MISLRTIPKYKRDKHGHTCIHEVLLLQYKFIHSLTDQHYTVLSKYLKGKRKSELLFRDTYNQDRLAFSIGLD